MGLTFLVEAVPLSSVSPQASHLLRLDGREWRAGNEGLDKGITLWDAETGALGVQGGHGWKTCCSVYIIKVRRTH